MPVVERWRRVRAGARVGIRWPFVTALLVAAALGVPAPARAEPTVPPPVSADQLACRMAASDPESRALWDQLVTNATYQDWFWTDIVPNQTTQCRSTVGSMFWNQAVPQNWATIPNIGGWPWASGGYYAQTLWLRAVPQNWATIPNIGGWPWATGGYYTQWFWLHAVPDNWATIPNIGGWPWATGGYYTQWLWLHAVPDAWVRPVTAAGGYFERTFWEAAVPQEWARRPIFALGGVGNRGYFFFWMYRFGANTTVDLNTYYVTQFQIRHHNGPGYEELWRLAHGYLPNAVIARPVNDWYAPDAHAVVIFSFDTEGSAASCEAVTRVLRSHDIDATFFTVAGMVGAGDPLADCIAPYDVENHTRDHPPAAGYDTPGPLNTWDNSGQLVQIQGADGRLESIFGRRPTAFRTPWCDSWKSFDGSVVNNLLDEGIRTDSSVPVVTDAAVADGADVHPALRNFSVRGTASPFIVGSKNGRNLVELPFAAPSDYLASTGGLDFSRIPADRGDKSAAVNVWKDIFDDIYAQRGTMVVLMHPWIEADDDGNISPVLDALISYMESQPGTYFSTIAEADARVRTHYSW